MKKFIIIQAIVSIILLVFLWDTVFLQPLQTFVVAVHESFHGIAAIITGGNVVSMDLNLNSGTLTSSGGVFPIISVAGYLGTALAGSLMILSTVYKSHRFVIGVLSIFTLVVSSLYINTLLSMSFYISVAISLVLLFVVIKDVYSKEVTIFMGTFFALASLEDVRTYLFAIPKETDAGILARYFGFEILTLPIAFTMMLISLIMWYFAIRKTLKEAE